MNQFCSGNIIRCPDNHLYIVYGGYFDKTVLIPFDGVNMTIHPSKEDIFETRYRVNPDTDKYEKYQYLLMYGIDKYTLEASTLNDYFKKQLNKFLGM